MNPPTEGLREGSPGRLNPSPERPSNVESENLASVGKVISHGSAGRQRTARKEDGDQCVGVRVDPLGVPGIPTREKSHFGGGHVGL